MSLKKTETLRNNNHKASFKNIINLESQLVPQRRSRSKSRVNKQKATSFSKTNRSRGLTQNHSQKQLGNSEYRRQTIGHQPRQRQKIFAKVYENRQNQQEQQLKRHKQKQAQFMKQIIIMKNSITFIQKNLQNYSNSQNRNPNNNQNISQIYLEQNAKMKILELNNTIDEFNIDFKTKVQRITQKYININLDNNQSEKYEPQVSNQLKHGQIILNKSNEVIQFLNMENLQQRLKQAQILLNKKKL